MSNPFLIRFYDIFITILSHRKTNFIFNPPLPTFTFSLFAFPLFRFSAFSKFKDSGTERFFPASGCVPVQGELISQCAAIWIPVPPDVDMSGGTSHKNERDWRTHALCVRQSRSFLWRVGSKADTGYQLPLCRDAPGGGEEPFCARSHPYSSSGLIFPFLTASTNSGASCGSNCLPACFNISSMANSREQRSL